MAESSTAGPLLPREPASRRPYPAEGTDGAPPPGEFARLERENRRLIEANAELTSVNGRLHDDNAGLRAANLDLSQVVEGTDVPTLLVDRDLQVIKANGPLGGAFPMPAPAAGSPVADFAARFDEPTLFLREIAEAIRSRTWGHRQVRTAAGHWYLLRALPFGAGPTAAGAVVTLTEVNGAQTVETRLQLAMSAARLIWWDWDFATGVIAVYGEAQCILGYGIDTLPRTQQAWLERTHPDDAAAVQAATLACVEGRTEEWSLIHRFRAADGSWRWVHNCGRSAGRNSRGLPSRMLGITRDVHEAHEASLLIRRDADILAHLQDAVLTTDAANRVVSVNEAYERILGWPRADVVGRPVFARLPEAAQTEAARVFDGVATGASVEVDWEDRRRDGSRVWIRWRAKPLLDERGRMGGAVYVGTDITARREATERQRQLQQQLFHAQKMDTLGTLAGGIAHDLNNILAAIFGYSELATMRLQGNPEMRQFHEEIVKAGVRGRELVKRILAFSRFEEPQRRPVRLKEVVADAAKFMRATLPSTVAVSWEKDEELPPVLADPHQLCQVLLNLATNAAHAMDHRGRFTVRVRSLDLTAPRALATGSLEPGRYVLIEAEDTGHGIPPEVLPRIFEPFFTTKREGEGTGLGLSVVRAIVDGHGGRIDVRSTPGRGTTFSIYLPREEAAPAPGERAARLVPAGAGQMIAVVDDEEQIASSTAAVLERLGYRTAAFDSALKFWEHFDAKAGGIDGIVTDQTMPGMTGLELVRRLRERGHDVPILVATGFSIQIRPEIVQQFPRLSVLRKPYEYRELGEAVHAMLSTPAATGAG